MTNQDRELFEKALEALEQSETTVPYEGFGMAHREAERKHQASITALRERLAQPQRTHWEGCEAVHPECRKPRREWVSLTDDDIAQAMYRADAIITGPMQFKFAREVEANLKEKNT